jgi:hypothetical protein
MSVARDVYSWMLGGKGRLETARSAEGLHWAVRRLKAEPVKAQGFTRKIDDPLVWAPYMHFGL